jgi:hypothetical protein
LATEKWNIGTILSTLEKLGIILYKEFLKSGDEKLRFPGQLLCKSL